MSILAGLILALALAGILIYAVIIYNELIRLRNDNDRAWANIEVLLKQRHDEIPNLVETVKGYMQHEQQTLLEVPKRVRFPSTPPPSARKLRPICSWPAPCAAYSRWRRIIPN